MSRQASERSFDVVLWGATGFTGQLVAEYLLQTHPVGELRLALAGRDEGKLQQVRAALAEQYPAAAALPLLVGDSFDAASLEAIARDTRVVCSTVGPFARYGRELVAACVTAGTHYCDITGEVPFIKDLIDRHHEAAAASGTRIVPSCGFDSIPSDLGVLLLRSELERRCAARLTWARLYVGKTRGGFSGGTVASMLDLLEQAKHDRDIRRVIADPYALNPPGTRPELPSRDRLGVFFDRDLGTWTAPFLMAPINTRVVRRSIALAAQGQGCDVAYAEVMSLGRGVGGWLRAVLVTAGLGAFVLALRWKPLRRLLQATVLPKPGEGPSPKEREQGMFKIVLLGKGVTNDGREVLLRCRVEGTSDPGYSSTARMLGESVVCLALDDETLTSPGGVLTPATAMGTHLVERLRRAGMVLEIEEGGDAVT